MARQSLTLARAKKLAADAIKDNDAHAEELIELFVRTTDQKASAESQTIKTEVLKTWYNATEHYREGFRDFIAQFEDEGPSGDGDELGDETLQSNDHVS